MASKAELELVQTWIDILSDRIAELQGVVDELQRYLDTGQPVSPDPDILDVLLNDEVRWALDNEDCHLFDMLDVVSFEAIAGDEVDFNDFDYSQAKYYILRGIKQADKMTTYVVREDRHKLMTAVEHLPSRHDAEAVGGEISPIVFVVTGLPESVDAFSQAIHYNVFEILQACLISPNSYAAELAQFTPTPTQPFIEFFHNIIIQAAFLETPPKAPMTGTIIFTFPGVTDERTLVAVWIRDSKTEFEDQTPLIQEVVEGFLYDKESPREYTHDESDAESFDEGSL